MSLPRNYDDWKTTDPADRYLKPEDEEEDENCTCSTTLRSRRNCLVHGVDPDHAYDEWRDRQMERDLDNPNDEPNLED
jgi:hypothetical protein